MSSALVQCPKCKSSPLQGAFNRAELFPCPSCEAPLQIDIFPALFRPLTTGSAGEAVMIEGESSCFYHPEKRAVVPCGVCGRFLCALCDCELAGQHLCPPCLESGRRQGKLHKAEDRRTLYDNVALALAIAPVLAWPLTVFTAPMALFIAIRYWNAPRSLARGTRLRFLLAIVLALLQIGGWLFFLVWAVSEGTFTFGGENG